MSNVRKPKLRYPIGNLTAPLDPSFILADPASRVPFAGRRTEVAIHKEAGNFIVHTNDKAIVRRFAGWCRGEGAEWSLVRIEGEGGFQTSWYFSAPIELISFRKGRRSRPDAGARLKGRKGDLKPKPQPAPATLPDAPFDPFAIIGTGKAEEFHGDPLPPKDPDDDLDWI